MNVYSLINDKNLKAEYLLQFLENRKKVTTTQAEMSWQGAVLAMTKAEYDCQQRRVDVDLESLKRSLMKSSEQGLSLHKDDRECYLGFSNDGNDNVFRLGYCYRGLRRILLSHEQVKRLSSAVVYEGDTFVWQGEWMRPLVSSTGRSNHIVAAYGWVELINGDINSVMLNETDLLSIERRDIERAIHFYNDENQSIYRSDWRKRMFEIEAIKMLFRHCADILELGNDYDHSVFANAATLGNQD